MRAGMTWRSMIAPREPKDTRPANPTERFWIALLGRYGVSIGRILYH